VASIPKSAGAEAQTEFKGANKLLREVAKTQTDRLERMMCHQRRWEADPWCDLFLSHPLLLRLAGGLIWGSYDEENRLCDSFRVLEDRTLTDHDDQAVEIAATSKIGILHPLELETTEREAWLEHLADYEITQPFPQVDRPVILPAEDTLHATCVTRWAGSKVNAMTFHGRTERLAWHRGPMRGKAYISTCWKQFPSHGIDGFLECKSDMAEFGDVTAQVTVGNLLFTRRSTFDPREQIWPDKDPSLPLDEVPPIVFSEAMYDVSRMTGV
jgi:hypothetical protein